MSIVPVSVHGHQKLNQWLRNKRFGGFVIDEFINLCYNIFNHILNEALNNGWLKYDENTSRVYVSKVVNTAEGNRLVVLGSFVID